MDDDEFDNLFDGDVIQPSVVKKAIRSTKRFKFELFTEDELIFSTVKEVENYENLGSRGERHMKNELEYYPFRITWSRV